MRDAFYFPALVGFAGMIIITQGWVGVAVLTCVLTWDGVLRFVPPAPPIPEKQNTDTSELRAMVIELKEKVNSELLSRVMGRLK